MSPHLLELLRNWWLVLRPKGYLFPGQDRINPLTGRHLRRICVEAARAAGITNLATVFSRYVILPKHAADALAL